MSPLLYLLATVAVVSSQTCKSVGMGPCDGKGGCRDPTTICTAIGTPDETCCAVNEVIPANLNPMATCRNVGLGQCTGNKYCGAAANCTSIGTRDEACCANNDVVLIPPPLPTIKPQPATTAKPCVDKVNPATGVSDCPQRTSYCNNAVYFDLMSDQCPRTCGRCTGGPAVTSKPSTSCVDKVNPSTGVSDCTRMASYCNNAAYFALMSDQCPRTCGRCTGGPGAVTTKPINSNCVDKVNPSTGISDCTRMASYCNNAGYYDLMTHECPKTCRRC